MQVELYDRLWYWLRNLHPSLEMESALAAAWDATAAAYGENSPSSTLRGYAALATAAGQRLKSA